MTREWKEGSKQSGANGPNPNEEPTITIREEVMVEGHFQDHDSPHGRYTSTTGARTLPTQDVYKALERFRKKDWGGILEFQGRANDRARESGEGIILAKYNVNHQNIWVHQAPKELPTVLLPSEF